MTFHSRCHCEARKAVAILGNQFYEPTAMLPQPTSLRLPRRFAPRNDNVRTAVQPTNLVIARPERPWQSQGTDHMNQPPCYRNQLPQDCHVTPSGLLAMTTEELRCDPPAFLLEVRFCRAKKSVGGSGRCNYPLFILKNPSSALVRGRGVFHGTMISTALLWLAMCTRSRAPPNSPSRVHFTGQGNSNSTWPVWKV